MRRGRFPVIAGLTLLASACATPPPPPPPPPIDGTTALPDWRAVIQPEDRIRLQRLDAAWSAALSEARKAGRAEQLRELGEAADPQARERGTALPPPGDYRCRTLKLGVGSLGLVAYGWFDCRIERTARGLRFTKISGSQRPTGLIFPDTEQRGVFLGSLSLGDEPPARSYGAQRERDIVAVVERIGPARWRLAAPWPHLESKLDVIELTPA